MANYNFGGTTAADLSFKDYRAPKSATQYADPFGDAPDYSMYSYEDMQRAQGKGNVRALGAAGMGALGTAAQIAAVALPTATDIENKKRLAELAKHKGLTDGERADIDEQAMRKVNAFAGESQGRTDQALAASGQHSARSLHNARLAEKDALNNATIQAADIGIRENRAQVQRDVVEEQERIAEKGRRQTEVRGLIGRALGEGVAATARPFAAGMVQDEPTDAQLLWMQSAKNPNTDAPLYPGLQGATDVDSIRRMYRKDLQQRRKADGATQITP